MTPDQFIYWLKGYMAAQMDCQIKVDIEKALKEVQTANYPYIGYRGASSTSTTTATTKNLLTDTKHEYE